ncbi:MAG: flagellar biosynthetic protein FliR [Alphaproteobacteria bacterium]|nr:flagellar biosynthetic protein FliR [Alphaproteobacteria bacterium]
MNLEDFLISNLFAHFLVFVRVGAAVSYMPLVGEQGVPVRIRLGFAILLSLVATPLVEQYLPPQPAAIGTAVLLIAGEAFIGFMFGLVARVMVLTLATAGQIISFQAGLAAAQAFNPSLQSQGALIGTFLTLLGIMVIIAANLHHLFIMALVDSYTVFVPGQPIPFGDISQFFTQVVAKSFLIAVQMSAPLLVIGLVLYIGVGLLARLMPQIQVFFIILPVQVALGLGILLLTLPATMMLFLRYFEEGMGQFLGP